MKTKEFEDGIPAGILENSVAFGETITDDYLSTGLSSRVNFETNRARALSTPDEKPKKPTPIIGDYWDVIKETFGDFIDEKEFWRVGWKYPLYYVKDFAVKFLSEKLLPGERRTNTFLDAIGAMFDRWKTQSEQDLSESYIKSFPGIIKMAGMVGGSTMIDEMYTIRHKGKLVPIFMKVKEGEDPSDSVITENARFVRDNNRSPYYQTIIPKKGVVHKSKSGYELRNLLEEDFKKQSIKEFTSGDSETFGYIRDPILEWVARFDTWLLAQYGSQSIKNIGGEQVAVFKRPEGFLNTLPFTLAYLGGDMVNTVRTGYTRAYTKSLAGIGAELSKHFLLNTKYKNLFRTLMGFTNPRGDILAYEF